MNEDGMQKALRNAVEDSILEAMSDKIIFRKKDFKRLQMEVLYKGINIAEHYAGKPEENEWRNKEIEAFKKRVDRIIEE